MESQKRNTERRGSFLILTIAVIFIILIVIAGICVNFLLTDELAAKIILLVLLGLIVLVGLFAFAFLECQRRSALKKRDRAAARWVRMTLAEQTQRNNRQAPPGESTWAYTTPWKCNIMNT